MTNQGLTIKDYFDQGPLPSDSEQIWKDIYYTSTNGLSLYVRHYPGKSEGRRPLVCLPGLTRNSKDFHALAAYLSCHETESRDVYCVDYRGRGNSEYDPDWRNYAPFMETIDVLDFMTLSGLHRAAILGTSRGGMIAMLMGAVRPTAIGAVILNDIGPVLEKVGIVRIKGYVGRTPLPQSWEEAGSLLQTMNERVFSSVQADDWNIFAKQWFSEDSLGRPAPGYDKNLDRALDALDVTKPLPTMWPQFRSLCRVPMLVIRGENSDILSEKTVNEMADVHPRLDHLTIAGQGHAPLLHDDVSADAIAGFLDRTDGGVIPVPKLVNTNRVGAAA